jgi:NAD+ synthase (glutamine-hydrolysing)
MKIALAQLDYVVGDIPGNSQKIVASIEGAGRAGAVLVVFSELAVVGYPPKDLLANPKFVRDNEQALESIAPSCRDISALVGFVRRNPRSEGRSLFNAAALLQNGRVAAEHYKTLLPTYDVFEELRYFEPAPQVGPMSVEAGGQRLKIGVTICEDLWNDPRFLERKLYHRNPLTEMIDAGAQLLVNVSASPFERRKQGLREKLFGGQISEFGVPLAFVNQVGGNDELIFDGASTFFAADGRVIARAGAFREDLLVVDTEALDGGARREVYPDEPASIFEALTLGLRDYVSKCGFRHVVLGLSGGIDSSLVACVAVEALGAEAVHGVAMPSQFNAEASLADARELASALGIDFRVIPIERIRLAYDAELAQIFDGLPRDVTEENVQARIRGNLLMALSNKYGWMLLTTGNKSEMAVGYCTLYGDMAGGLAVISDVPKNMVYELCRYYNEWKGRPVVPERVFGKAPSAELRPNQTDQDSLPPYDLLDRIIHLYVEENRSADQIAGAGLDPALVRQIIGMIDRSEYKRKQAPPGLKVTSKAFGYGRRVPIAQRYRP